MRAALRTCCLALLAIVALRAAEPQTTDGLLPLVTPPASLSKAREIRVPELTLREVPVSAAVALLRNLSRKLDPARKGVNFFILLPGGESPRVTLQMTDIPMDRAASYVADAANLQLVADENALCLVPPVGRSDLVTKEYKVSDKFLAALGDQKPRAFLQKLGVPFPGGAATNVIHGKLILRSSAEAHHMLGAEVGALPVELPSPGREDGIVLPLIALHGATLAEAVDFVRAKAQAAKREDAKTVSIRLKVDPATAAKRISLELANISLPEALRFIAIAGGIDLVRDGRGFALQPGNQAH